MKKLFLPIFLLMVGCASLPLVETQDLNDVNSRSKYMYDVETNIAYKVQHDDDFIYLEFKTDNEINIQKILRNGLFVYMDPKAGKSEDIYFNYPLQRQPGRGGMKKMMQNRMQSGEEPEFNVNTLLEVLDVEAVYSKNDMAEMIPIYARSNGFKVELFSESGSELIYKLRIPINEIVDSRTPEQEISLGIESGEFVMPGGGQGGQRGGMQGGGPGGTGGGMSGGGGRSGGMQGGGPGGMGGNMPSSEELSEMKEQVSIWFKISI